MKRCTRCNLKKRRSEFYHHLSSPDGLRYGCKDCMKKEARRWEKNHKKQLNVRLRSWKVSNPEKTYVHAFVARAIKQGKIERPTRCSNCRIKGKIQGHHDDYSKPLKIRWLCKSCHWKADRKLL